MARDHHPHRGPDLSSPKGSAFQTIPYVGSVILYKKEAFLTFELKQ